MPSAPLPAISTARLCKRYGHSPALDSLDLSVEVGQIFGLLGPNGAGKSTAIKILTTLLDASSGQALVAGFDVARQPVEVRRRIGYVPQLLSADGALTATENLDLSARLHGLSGTERAHRVAAALQFAGLEGMGRQLVRTFSGGMVRRLEIAQATLHDPEVLFLDEPTMGLDPVARRTVWAHLRQLRADKAMTILLCTHDMEEADLLCDELALLHRGRLAAVGRPQALKDLVGPKASLADVFVHFSGQAIESAPARDWQEDRAAAWHRG